MRKYEMDQCKSFPTPLATTTNLDHDLDGPKVDDKLYRRMIGSLTYLTASRPNILFVTSLCARFQCDPRGSHLTMVKMIMRYLKGSNSLCLWYPKFKIFDVLGYSDADYAGYLVDRKSTSGMA